MHSKLLLDALLTFLMTRLLLVAIKISFDLVLQCLVLTFAVNFPWIISWSIKDRATMSAPTDFRELTIDSQVGNLHTFGKLVVSFVLSYL